MNDFLKKIFGTNSSDNNEKTDFEYWFLGGVYNDDSGLCSDNYCPCPQVTIPRGEGYIYIDQHPNGNFTANLTCEQGAKLRSLNLEVARKDAIHWWATGRVPKRATPKI
jgi:hypothetical protein